MKLFITLSKKNLAVILAGIIISLLVLGQLFSAESKAIDGSTNAIRMAYLGSLGLKADDTNVSSKNIIIPVDFDEVYTQYNSLQKKAGFDLTRHKGAEATVYTYPLQGNSDYSAHLIVCGGEIIGGDIASISLNGEMQPLIKK